ncbi:hypothetical protein PSTT_11788 [Puccinia striiformis]|uniref:Uncharacterized protein n=1 Tax=Puccinia striiformis TaxID=27350 RepID=A0A2S4UYU9_9BASI|nr:hypothetical protein PSTT_11788 [Puccinia striiformis]
MHSRLPLLTKMSPDQVEFLCTSTRRCSDTLDEFQSFLLIKGDPQVFPSDLLTGKASKLHIYLNSGIYFVSDRPLFRPGDLPAQDHCRAWPIDEYTAFNLTPHNFHREIET